MFDVLFDRLVLVGHCYFVTLIMGFLFYFSVANGTIGIVGYIYIFVIVMEVICFSCLLICFCCFATDLAVVRSNVIC